MNALQTRCSQSWASPQHADGPSDCRTRTRQPGDVGNQRDRTRPCASTSTTKPQRFTTSCGATTLQPDTKTRGEALDEIALGVSASIQSRLLLSAGVRMNDSFDSERLELRSNRVRVVCRVRYERIPVGVSFDDSRGYRRVVLLTRRDLDVDRAPFRVDEGVDLRGEATSRTTQCIPVDPPFPPAESWWARTIEASMMRPSSSTSYCRASKILLQCPRRDQFENLL